MIDNEQPSEEPNDKPRNLYDTLQNIEKYMAEQKEKGEAKTFKKWKLPFGKGKLSKRKKKDGWIIVEAIGENNSITFTKAKIDEGVIMVNEIPHYITAEDIFIYENKIPMAIVPQWSERPISPKAYRALVEDKGQGSVGYKFIMNYLHKTQITDKKKNTTGLIIIGIIVVIGIAWYAIKSGAFG